MNPAAITSTSSEPVDARAARNAAARARSFERSGSEEFDLGFHGDRYLLDLLAEPLAWADNFIETGANLANTTIYVARLHPDLRVRSCEPGAAAFSAASKRAARYPNIQIRETTSPEFLHDLARENPAISTERNFFFLDAHGYGFHWPLGDEIEFITSKLPSAMLLIDDLLVPGRPWFGFDQYEEQVCSLEALRPRFAPARQYRVIYPAYQDRTSPHHALRGYGLICFGEADAVVPAEHTSRFERITFHT